MVIVFFVSNCACLAAKFETNGPVRFVNVAAYCQSDLNSTFEITLNQKTEFGHK